MNQRSNARMIAELGVLTAVALVLGYLERLIPITAVPGIKLGLANTVLLYALFMLDTRRAWLLMLLKVGLSGLLFGGASAMLYSLSGGVLSLCVMLLVRRAKGFGVVGVSVAGAIAHNLGQMAVACFVVQTRAILAYLPVLLIAAVVTGFLTGIVAQYTLRALKGTGARKSDESEETNEACEKRPPG